METYCTAQLPYLDRFNALGPRNLVQYALRSPNIIKDSQLLKAHGFGSRSSLASSPQKVISGLTTTS